MERGALSQAWCTALRLANNASPSLERTHAPRATAKPLGIAVELGANRRLSDARSAAFSRASRASIALGAEEPCGPRRSQRATLAQRIERAFAGASRTKRATFSLGRGDARVHVILQTIGERATLLAICRAEQRPIVARALLQARVALARRGIGVELCPLGERACS